MAKTPTTGLKYDDVSVAQQGMDREQIAQTANATVPPATTKPQTTISSETLASNVKPVKLPPTIPSTLADGTQEYIAAQNNSIKSERQQQLDMEKAKLDSSRNEITSLIEDLGNQGQMKEDIYKEQGVDVARKQVDDYTSQLEAEQLANIRRIEALRKNPQGLFGGALEQEINRVNMESLEKQANVAILQNNALRKYGTAADIADRMLEAKIEPIKAKLEALKFFYQENKADFNKQDDRLYQELIKKQERDFEEKKTNIQLAFASGLKNKYINKGGTIFRASDGEIKATPEEFFAETGVSSFEEAYARGLIGDVTAERIADMEFVQKARETYPTAGISFTDTAEEAAAKIQQTDKYKKENYIDNSYTLSAGQIRYDGNGNIVAVGPEPEVDTSKITDDERSLLGQFTSNPIVKNFNEVQVNKLKIDNIIKNGVGGPGDLALVFNFMKALDPSSVVRETEYQTAAKSGNIFQGVYARFNGYLKENGGFLPENVKKEFQNLTNQAYQATESQYTNWRDQIRAIAERQNLNPDNVAPDLNSYLNPQGSQIIEYNGKKYQTDEQGNFDPNNPIGENPLNLSQARGSGGLTFSPAGNASASNQVKGMVQSAPKMQTINANPAANVLASSVSKFFPAGSVGGQCGDFVRKVVNKFGGDYPRLGDSLTSKVTAVQNYGTSAANARAGSVIVTRENPTYGHVAYIIGKNAQGYIVAESNFKQSNRVSYGRVIPYNSPKIVGVINPRGTA